jgi:Multiubiquitin
MADEAAVPVGDAGERREPSFRIQIDRAHYTVHQERMTGEELRHVPPTPIPPDRDLYEVRPGETDLLIANDYVVHIRDGLRFFTAPHHINPGSEA